MLLHVEVPEPKLKRWTPEALEHLPKLVLIADRFCTRPVAHATVQAVQAGVAWVHLRDHTVSRERFWEVGRNLVGRIRRVNEDVLVSINRYADFAAEWYCGAHVGAAGPSLSEAKSMGGINGPVGYSAHTLDVAHASFDSGADYVFYSPIFPTESKPDHPGEGVDELSRVSEFLAPKRVYALGGITPDRIAQCMEAGAAGVAVVSGIIGAEDPASAALAYLEVTSKW